ncbi:pentapeptide repeat-containing protein [Mycobacterium sp. Aquia_213]|uniref:pentapeptide repeat-containing protein n=1 Tax=Mycobacterium sp. Aquia_213 TaxID=2991728 RepID=UPI00226F32A0|nr:pentapeptide repeat-containing protein [Mycobacterium sp. Aquia_213]WAC90055.1 pentapeptide repeat-containing protein [Mycobacterium sp. Aquia_213]
MATAIDVRDRKTQALPFNGGCRECSRPRRNRPEVAGRPGPRHVPLPTPAPSPNPPPDGVRKRHGIRWWLTELVIPTVVALVTGAIVAAGTIKGQALLDDAREDRALRLENLRFVRDHSTADPNQPRPFGGLDLSGQHLRGLQLANANFDDANLEGAIFNNSNLHRASFNYARLINANLVATDLSETDMEGADLSGADLDRANLAGANFDQTALYGANLKAANLSGASLRCIYYDASTSWPPGFVPPPGRDQRCAARAGLHR